MKIEVYRDMIVIHSPDGSEDNQFKGILGFKEDKYLKIFLEILAGTHSIYSRHYMDVNYNEDNNGS
jgi:hypothetical protein